MRNQMHRPATLLACTLAVSVAPTASIAQQGAGTPVELASSFRFPSAALQETRVVDVSLPAGYDSNTAQRYPVLFVLDGEFEGEIAAAITRFYASTSRLPPLIVVAVRNTDRNRDLTPAPVAGFRVPAEAAGAGGAERFLTFLTDELAPWVDRRYRTAPMRVLAGHSLGGLFALYALTKRPEFFTGYLVMEPATWWNNQHEFQQAQAILRQPAARRARVMMVNTDPLGLDTTAWGGTKPMVRHLTITDETHSSMAAAGMMQGLRLMFADFQPTQWRPGTRPIAMLDRYDSLAARVGYPVPVPEDTYSTVIRMSLDSRHFDDAARALDRMERVLGASPESRTFRARIEKDRATPLPGFIPLEFPARRPTARDAARFIGRWVTIAQPDTHEVIIRAAGDTIIVHDRLLQRNGEWFEGDDPVIQLTPEGTLEWGLPFFRGLAALVVLKGRVGDDGTMTVTREPRGWVPRGPDDGSMRRVERFRRVR
jgi:predicted alpha/beta superfamily hydrolase